MTSAAIDVPTVAIVGGGFSGAAVAYHLAKAKTEARIVIFEPRELLGAGLAYSDADPAHRINVPATRMSLLPDDGDHFARWLAASGALDSDPGALAGGAAFSRRLDFGRYVDATLRPLIADGSIVHIRDAVVSVRRTGRDWILRAARGEETGAQFLVIATTHPKPKLPAPLDRFAGDARLVEDGLAAEALDRIQPRDRVLIVGNGLTAADIVASLDARGHTGGVTMISRRGLRSRGHPQQPYPPEGDFVAKPARSATQLVAAIRLAVRNAVAEGRSWHPVLDAVRSQGGAIWAALEPDARRRVVRHLRPFWDVHRFRAAPQIDAVLDRKLADGSLELRKAGLGQVERAEDGFVVELLDRRRGSAQSSRFDRIVVATGPAHGDILRAQPYLSELAGAGAVALDATGLGLKTALDGHAVGTTGDADPTLFIAGPLARGTFGELMGLPQVSEYALFIARRLVAALSEARAWPAARRVPVPSAESVL